MTKKELQRRVDELESVVAFCYGTAQAHKMFEGEARRRSAVFAVQEIIRRVEQTPGWKSED